MEKQSKDQDKKLTIENRGIVFQLTSCGFIEIMNWDIIMYRQ